MAKIKTDRPEAAIYNGRDGRFVREVTDGPAFSPRVHQCIVEIDGNELYFFQSEVTLSEEEIESGAEAAKARDEVAKKAADLAGKNVENKNKELEYTAPGGAEAKAKDNEAKVKRGETVTKTGVNPSAKAMPGAAAANADTHGGRDVRANRLPGDPPDTPQTDHMVVPQNPAPMPTVTEPGADRAELPLPSGAQPGAGSKTPPAKPK